MRRVLRLGSVHYATTSSLSASAIMESGFRRSSHTKVVEAIEKSLAERAGALGRGVTLVIAELGSVNEASVGVNFVGNIRGIYMRTQFYW